MNLVFKNKMLMAIDSMLKEGVERRGGIPKHIQLSKEEVVPFIQEYLYLRAEKREGVLKDRANITDTIIVQTYSAIDSPLQFYLNKNRLTKPEMLAVIKAWALGKLKFFYKYNSQQIPIITPNLKKDVVVKDEGKEWE